MPDASPTPTGPASIHGFGDFACAFRGLLNEEQLERISAGQRPRGGGSPKLSLWQWLMARVYHEFTRIGSFSASVKEITRVRISDAALSQRASSIGKRLLEQILPEVLDPLADEESHPDAFHGGYRLLAVDGMRFNLRNTESINARAFRTRCSKGGGQPAFAHLQGVVLVEVGLHQPLGAAFGWQGEGELTLFRRLFAGQPLPARSLLLGDRLYGTPSLLWEQKAQLEATGSAALLRVRSNLRAKRIEQLADGSWLVDVKVRERGTRARTVLGSLRLREIHAKIHYEGSENPLVVRFWTTLLDAEVHPAAALVEIYATRWEEELFFRELKSYLHGKSELLDAQTPETAVQEVLAMLLAAALVAVQRKEVARRAGVSVLRISFAKVYQKTSALCEFVALGGELIPPPTLAALLGRMLDELKTSALIPRRKPRTCPRTLRQPVKRWPKTKEPESRSQLRCIELTNP